MEKVRSFLNKNINVTFVSAFVFGIFINIFGLVNTIHNYDDIAIQPFGFGTSVTSGRFILGALGGIYHLLFGSYNLPFLNGTICLLFIALAARCLVSIFDIQNKKLCVVIGLLFAVFPATTSIIFFKFTAIYYGFAVYLAVLAAKVLINKKYGFILAVLLNIVSLGIYQAYLPLTVTILLVYLIKRSIDNEQETFLSAFKTGLFYCANIAVSLVAYKLILDGTLLICNYFIENQQELIAAFANGESVEKLALNSYQGIDKMGNLTFSQILSSLLTSIKTFFFLPIDDYCSLAQTILLKISYAVLYISALSIIAISLIKKKKNAGVITIVALMWLLFPVAVNLIVIMCPTSDIYTLMVYSFIMVLCTPLLLWESAPVINKNQIYKVFKNILAVTYIVVVFSYSVLLNLNYSKMYFYTQQAQNYVNSITTQVRMCDGFDTDKKWVFIGDINDPLLKNDWDNVPSYGIPRTTQDILNMYSRKSWFSNYVGYSIPWANDKAKEIKKTEEFKSMPCWPDEGSIKVIDKYVVVKFEE